MFRFTDTSPRTHGASDTYRSRSAARLAITGGLDELDGAIEVPTYTALVYGAAADNSRAASTAEKELLDFFKEVDAVTGGAGDTGSADELSNGPSSDDEGTNTPRDDRMDGAGEPSEYSINDLIEVVGADERIDERIDGHADHDDVDLEADDTMMGGCGEEFDINDALTTGQHE